MTVALDKKPLTAEDFYEFACRPENDNKWLELVRGEVIERPAPTKPHGVVAMLIGADLIHYARQQRRFYVTGNHSGVILARDPDSVRGPDVAVYDDASRFVELHPKYGEIVPLLAVEVVSASERPGQVARKVKEYLDAGVKMVWTVYPEERLVISHRRGNEPSLFGLADHITGEDVLPGLNCAVAHFFTLPGEGPVGSEGGTT